MLYMIWSDQYGAHCRVATHAILDQKILVICSRNRVTGPVPKFLTRFQIRVITTQFSTAIVQNTTTFGLYSHLFTTLNSIVALMYFRLRIHKLRRSIIRRED